MYCTTINNLGYNYTYILELEGTTKCGNRKNKSQNVFPVRRGKGGGGGGGAGGHSLLVAMDYSCSMY